MSNIYKFRLNCENKSAPKQRVNGGLAFRIQMLQKSPTFNK